MQRRSLSAPETPRRHQVQNQLTVGYEESREERLLTDTTVGTPARSESYRNLEVELELGREQKDTGLERVVGLRNMRRTGAIVIRRSSIVLGD